MGGAIVSSHYFLFGIDNTHLDKRFLDYFIRTPFFREQVVAQGSTNYAAIRPKDVLEYKIPLPPLSKQQRIVAKIEDLTVKIEASKRLKRQTMVETETFLKITKRQIFHSLLEKYSITLRLDEVSSINMGESPPGESYNNVGEGTPLLNGPTEFGKTYPTPVQWTTSPTKICKQGDILLCVRATIGKMNWADKEYCIGRGLAALTMKTDICIPKYAYYFIETQTQEMLSRTAGSTFPNLPCKKLRTLIIPIPHLSEQHRIVEYLDNLQSKVAELKTFQVETQKELDALIPSILDKAFR